MLFQNVTSRGWAILKLSWRYKAIKTGITLFQTLGNSLWRMGWIEISADQLKI